MKQFLFSSIITLLACLFIGGCAPAPGFTYGELREEIWIAPFDYWYVKIIWTFDASETNRVFPQIETFVTEKCQQASANSVSCKLVKQRNMDGGVTLLIESSGQRLEFLNLAAFDGKANVQRDTRGHVLIYTSFPISGLRYYSLSLHGGPIIQSNATEQNLFFAFWENPSDIQIKTMTFYPIPLLFIFSTFYPIYCVTGLFFALLLLLMFIKKIAFQKTFFLLNLSGYQKVLPNGLPLSRR